MLMMWSTRHSNAQLSEKLGEKANVVENPATSVAELVNDMIESRKLRLVEQVMKRKVYLEQTRTVNPMPWSPLK